MYYVVFICTTSYLCVHVICMCTTSYLCVLRYHILFCLTAKTNTLAHTSSHTSHYKLRHQNMCADTHTHAPCSSDGLHHCDNVYIFEHVTRLCVLRRKNVCITSLTCGLGLASCRQARRAPLASPPMACGLLSL